MATNKNALIRYLTIDKCLQNTMKKWTLESLIEACSDALYEYEGKDTFVSKRTVQLDIQTMRSDKLGYNAPIIVYERKYYKYEKANYSITEIPITEIDLDILTESMEMLRQFKSFSLFTELNGVIQKLEDKVFRETKDQTPIIHLDKNEHLKGREHLDTIYQAILKQFVLTIQYQSFKAKKPTPTCFIPYILKEFNNRWFVVGRRDGSQAIVTLALDRIKSIEFDLKTTYTKPSFDPDEYYSNTIGVTVMSDKDLLDIELEINPANAPYVITKPFHSSQKLIEKFADGSIRIGLCVQHNFELERLILGFGSAITVLKPRRLRQRIKRHVEKSYQNYFKD